MTQTRSASVPEAEARMRNIVLFGFMGTGKTAAGKRLARLLGMAFVDMDDVIVEWAQKSIPAIFTEDGEPHFRKIERDVVRHLAEQNGLVIATGGGVVLNPENVADLSRSGLSVCLQATPDAILARVEHDTNRPLLAVEDKMGRIRAILSSRQALYDALPHQVNTTDLSLEETVAQIMSLYRSERRPNTGDEDRVLLN